MDLATRRKDKNFGSSQICLKTIHFGTHFFMTMENLLDLRAPKSIFFRPGQQIFVAIFPGSKILESSGIAQILLKFSSSSSQEMENDAPGLVEDSVMQDVEA